VFFARRGTLVARSLEQSIDRDVCEIFAVYHHRAYVPKSLFIAAQYRERAARLRADAEHVASPKGREDFLALAENWDILADAAERGAERATGDEKTAGPTP
jgi:hypothetical protein